MRRQLFAWAGAALFAFSLGLFFFTYMVTFAVAVPGPARPGDIAWNVGLFTIFAIHHSVFARPRVRAWVSAIVPDGLERSFYVWMASLLLIGVCGLWRPVGGVAWAADGPLRVLLWVLQAAGLWLTVHGASVIDIHELDGVRQASEAETPTRLARSTSPTRPFKTSGPYGWMRHPIYTGWFLLVLAVSPMTMTRLVFAVISSVYLLIAIPFEEASLRESSAGAYDDYMRQVRWKLLPGVF